MTHLRPDDLLPTVTVAPALGAELLPAPSVATTV
jgi:hypothetical protein